MNKLSNQRKCTKSHQRNWKQIKKFNKYRKKSKRNESYCCYQEKPKILQQICKKTTQRTELELDISRMTRETWNQATKKWANYWMNNTIASLALWAQRWLLSIQWTSFDTHRQIHCQKLSHKTLLEDLMNFQQFFSNNAARE